MSNGRANGRPMSTSGIIASVIVDAERLVALEVALAKQELREFATANAIAAGVIVFGGLLAVLGLLVAIPSLVVWLVPWHSQAAAVWAASYIVVGVFLVLIGRGSLQFRLPPRTMGSLKESREWALRRVKSKSK